jgi:ubiquitin C-terminal hydrolase
MQTNIQTNILQLGFNNPGALCYFNSLVQSLLSLNSLNNTILESKGDSELYEMYRNNLKNGIKEDFTSKLLKLLQKNIKMEKEMDFGNMQEDANECLVKLLDALHSAAVYILFNSLYCNDIYCANCNKYLSTAKEVLPYIVIDRDLKDTEHFTNYLLKHQNAAIMDYKSGCCQNKARSVYNLLIGPKVLCILFPKYFVKTNYFFPIEFNIHGIHEIKYNLIAQVEQFGSQNGGHYTTRCLRNGIVYNFNDISVSKSKFEITKETYLLFYER